MPSSESGSPGAGPPALRSAYRFGLPPMAAAIAATTVAQFPMFLTGALAVQIGRDIGLPASGLGIAVAAFFASSAVCSAWLGKLADRLGGGTMMRWGIVPAAVALVWIGAGVQHWWGLVGALGIAGCANGSIQPGANRHLTRTVAGGRQGLAFGVKQAAIPAGTLLSGVAVPAVGHTIGWRWAFLAAAVLAVAVGATIPRPAPSARGAAARATRGQEASGAPFARRALIVLAIGIAMASGGANAIGSYFVLSAHQVGVSDSVAGSIVAGASIVSLLVRIGIGLRADRRTTGHLWLVAVLCAVGAVGPLLLSTGRPSLLVVAAVVGYGAGWGWAGLFNFAVARTHRAAPGRATGLTGVGGSVGGCLGPLAFGFLAGHLGYPAAWLLVSVLLLAAAVTVLIGRRMLLTTGIVRSAR